MLVARLTALTTSREKIATFCNVRDENVFCSPTVETVYEIPGVLEAQGLMRTVAERMKLDATKPDLAEWKARVEALKQLFRKGPRVKIGVVGKYAVAKDAYASVFEALCHAGVANGVHVEAELADSEALEKGKPALEGYDAIVVPGGFGGRGVEGKIMAVKHCRENGVPYLGLCYGLQLAVIGIARNAAGLEGANTTENEPNAKHPVIDLLPEQKNVVDKGGTMRLGAKWVELKPDTQANGLYGVTRYSSASATGMKSTPVRGSARKAGVVLPGCSKQGQPRGHNEDTELPGHRSSRQVNTTPSSTCLNPEPLFNVRAAAKNARRKQVSRGFM